MRKQNWIINRLGDGFYASRYGTIPRRHNADAYAPLMPITAVAIIKGKAIQQNECSLCGWTTPARRYAIGGNLGRRKQAWSKHLESAHGPVGATS